MFNMNHELHKLKGVGVIYRIKSMPLFQSQDKSTGGLNPEPCPICARPLGQEVSTV